MAETILVVDDEREIADLVEVYLAGEGYQVMKCYSALEALAVIDREKLDLAILDVMLPGMSGFELCRHIRTRHHYPVIMLTAKIESTDKINGLALGADDYVTKPFLPLELMARVKAQLRRYKRYNQQEPEEELILCGGLMLNLTTFEATVNDRPMTLTPTEFAILRILCQRRGSVVSAEELFRAVWGEEYYSKNNSTITVHIRHLRQKMGESFDNPRYIKTVWGVGYKIDE
ncbi:MAG: response regulator transcription factor [Eubacteriales bacterium]|nr:response regulator transcription factor [Eubacteriales bacterium]